MKSLKSFFGFFISAFAAVFGKRDGAIIQPIELKEPDKGQDPNNGTFKAVVGYAGVGGIDHFTRALQAAKEKGVEIVVNQGRQVGKAAAINEVVEEIEPKRNVGNYKEALADRRIDPDYYQKQLEKRIRQEQHKKAVNWSRKRRKIVAKRKTKNRIQKASRKNNR